MKIFTDRKCAAIMAAVLYVAALVAILSCRCTGDTIVTAFLKEGGHFNPSINYSSFTDSRDSKTYKIVVIGGKTWMAENLNYAATSSWCYENKNSLCDVYGRLYTWDVANNVCPSGWHLPTRAEWDELVSYAGGSSAGKKLKSKMGWYRSGNGTDDYGFSALAGGSRGSGGFGNVGYLGNWWSATEGGGGAYRRDMNHGNDYVNEYGNGKSVGFSVRCVGAAQ